MPFVLCEDPGHVLVHADTCPYFLERDPQAATVRWYTGLRSSHEALALARRLAGPRGEARLALCCLRGRVRGAAGGRLPVEFEPPRLD